MDEIKLTGTGAQDMNCTGCKALSETYQCKLRHTIKRTLEDINGHQLQRIYTLEDCAKPLTDAQHIEAFDLMIAEDEA